MAVCCPGFYDATTSSRLGLWQLLTGRRSHLVQRRDCPGVSACYTVPASSRHVLDKAHKRCVIGNSAQQSPRNNQLQHYANKLNNHNKHTSRFHDADSK